MNKTDSENGEKTPNDLAKGDRLEVKYDPANGEQTQTLTGTVADVERQTDGETVHIVTAEVVPDDEVRVERGDHYANESEASRRVEFDRRSDGGWSGYEIEGKNGARWNRLSRVSGVESWTLRESGATQNEGGDQ